MQVLRFCALKVGDELAMQQLSVLVWQLKSLEADFLQDEAQLQTLLPPIQSLQDDCTAAQHKHDKRLNAPATGLTVKSQAYNMIGSVLL